jgi:transcription elongation factor Elf1
MDSKLNQTTIVHDSEFQLNIACPFCGHAHEDCFEILDTNKMDSMRCHSCRKSFALMLMECERCADEQMFVWSEVPPAIEVVGLACQACGEKYRHADASDEHEAASP